MSRRDARSKSLRKRPSRVVPASIVAVLIAAIGVLTLLGVILRLANGRWAGPISYAARALAALTWGSAVMITATILIALLGLILLVAAIKPGHARTANLTAPPQDDIAERDYVISRRGIARLAAAQADAVDGVERVSTSATGNRVHLSILTPSEQTDQIRSRVVERVTATLRSTGLDPLPRIDASVRTKEI